MEHVEKLGVRFLSLSTSTRLLGMVCSCLHDVDMVIEKELKGFEGDRGFQDRSVDMWLNIVRLAKVIEEDGRR